MDHQDKDADILHINHSLVGEQESDQKHVDYRNFKQLHETDLRNKVNQAGTLAFQS